MDSSQHHRRFVQHVLHALVVEENLVGRGDLVGEHDRGSLHTALAQSSRALPFRGQIDDVICHIMQNQSWLEVRLFQK
jgi:hypothetical protein